MHPELLGLMHARNSEYKVHRVQDQVFLLKHLILILIYAISPIIHTFGHGSCQFSGLSGEGHPELSIQLCLQKWTLGHAIQLPLREHPDYHLQIFHLLCVG